MERSRIMRSTALRTIATGLLVVGLLPRETAANGDALPGIPVFERDVVPILKAYCWNCHGGEARTADLDMRTLPLLLKPRGGRGAAVVPGKADESPLYRKLAAREMPPGDALPPTDAQVAIIRRWIDSGAKARYTGGPLTEEQDPPVAEVDREWWAFQKPRLPTVPTVAHSDRVRTPVDAFLLRALEAEGLGFAPDADRVTLIRRVSLDLIGLPPQPDEIDAFVSDSAPGAYERLVHRLLASPHYGERWGRHWLDAAGYVDTLGTDNDAATIEVHENIWKYRDYVIRSLNDDKPYDQFLLEQLAGDELVDWRNTKQFTPEMRDALIATGFLRQAADATYAPELNTADIRHQVLYDIVQIVSSNLLGLTIHCARCHTHKFDPISHADYYRLTALFTPAYNPHDWKSPKERYLGEKIPALWDVGPPPPAYLYRRGDYRTPGAAVRPGVPAVLDDPANPFRVPDGNSGRDGDATSGYRSAFARWLTRPDHPLTSRVIVNRVWQHYFGRGIVATPDNFGFSGALPTHPQLLDWLAVTFVREGWSLKRLHRLIVTSTAYRQASGAEARATWHNAKTDPTQVDPENTLLWRMPLRRLESEIIRDQVLAVSGLLNPAPGGPPIPLKPNADGSVEIDRAHLAHPADAYRRSVYVLARRNYQLTELNVFDQPLVAHNCTRRTSSAVVLQSLTMLNGRFLLDQAAAFADRVHRIAGDDERRQIETVFRLAYCRRPTTEEIALSQKLLEKQATRVRNQDGQSPQQAADAALTHLCQMVLNGNEFLYVP